MEANIVFYDDKIVKISDNNVEDVSTLDINESAIYGIRGDVLRMLIGLYQDSHGMQVLGVNRREYRVAYFAKTKEEFEEKYLKGFSERFSDYLRSKKLEHELHVKDIELREMIVKCNKLEHSTKKKFWQRLFNRKKYML